MVGLIVFNSRTAEDFGATYLSRRPVVATQAGAEPSGMGFEQQFRWWHAALSVALLRREGRNGRDGRAICP